jgi:hypothetical protein
MPCHYAPTALAHRHPSIPIRSPSGMAVLTPPETTSGFITMLDWEA